ncbi:MAG: pyruvate, phosphate dikinase [Desulfovibrio sp.]|jgi:pyruvate,water dikinase|nr:pyruvate, phosphate dikinase [Desulfovibrio sp.]
MSAVSALKKFFGFAARAPREQAMTAFTRRYASFKDLLDANAELAAIFAELEAAQHGERPLEAPQVRQAATRAVFQCERMAEKLNDISGGRHAALGIAVKSTAKRIGAELDQHAAEDAARLTLPLAEVDAGMAYSVGGKNANLGELGNVLGMPVPRGFAVTLHTGSMLLLRPSGLFKNIYTLLRSVDPEAPATLRAAFTAIESLILQAETPKEIEEALFRAWDGAFGDEAGLRAALRSSAAAEDGTQSFAGQYRTILGVSRRTLINDYKKIIASLFSERALAYRALHGYPLDAMGMGVCCLEMVKAKSAGVAFSRHPVDLRSNCLVVNGHWGLGEMVADGKSCPDTWLVSRATKRLASERIARKTTMIVLADDGKTQTRIADVPEPLQDAPSLTREQVTRLAGLLLALERHYQFPQDVEWAVDSNDEIVLLQTRPMGIDATADMSAPELADYRPLFSGADVAARGVGCGPVARVGRNGDTTHFPEGGVMLIRHSSPRVVAGLRRASAIIAETGSLTGHMASLCREFGVPTLMNLPDVFRMLEPGRIVTVDAFTGRIFDGEIPELLALGVRRKIDHVDKPVLFLLRRVAPHILPLHLTDPQSGLFTPENCLSLHDAMRFAHEKSYAEMFRISDNLSESGEGAASRLVCSVPLDLHVIDLGGGLKNPDAPSALPEEVTSVPFRQVLAGMTHPDVQANGPRPVNMRGFLSVMGRSVAGGNQEGGARFGDRSYAIVSDRYLNLSSRVGYHYAILDTWCGGTLSKNYIRFEFAGGAAGNAQRVRRVRCIALILSELGFTVDVTGDRVRARFRKYSRAEMLPRLDQLGRLLIMTRQMDMLMVDEDSVGRYADNFLKGSYH